MASFTHIFQESARRPGECRCGEPLTSQHHTHTFHRNYEERGQVCDCGHPLNRDMHYHSFTPHRVGSRVCVCGEYKDRFIHVELNDDAAAVKRLAHYIDENFRGPQREMIAADWWVTYLLDHAEKLDTGEVQIGR